jgi:hypothetical protein
MLDQHRRLAASCSQSRAQEEIATEEKWLKICRRRRRTLPACLSTADSRIFCEI